MLNVLNYKQIDGETGSSHAPPVSKLNMNVVQDTTDYQDRLNENVADMVKEKISLRCPVYQMHSLNRKCVYQIICSAQNVETKFGSFLQPSVEFLSCG